MNRKVLLLNLALLALIGVLLWQLRLRRQATEAHESAVLRKGGQGRALLPPPPPAPVPPVAPSEYIDSVQKMLFSKDRNPNVVVDPPPPPKPEPPPPPMPPLPHYYGQMHFGGPAVVVLSSAAANDQKAYEVGGKIGDFTVVAFDRDTITLDWDGKPVVRNLDDLRPKSAQQPGQPAAAPPPPPPAQGSSVTSIGGDSSAGSPPPAVGADIGGGNHACTSPDDGSPAGTVVGGYRKVISQGLMGKSCYWEQMK